MGALMGSALMRALDVLTGILPRVTATSFGGGLHMDGPSRRRFLAGVGRDGARAFHAYMRDARKADAIYESLAFALTAQFGGIPMYTIFGERNDPLGFQARWKQLFPDASQIVAPNGNHFPRWDDPDLVAMFIRELHREVGPLNEEKILVDFMPLFLLHYSTNEARRHSWLLGICHPAGPDATERSRARNLGPSRD